ncbi:hypothetical protein BIV23_06530 [Streptomyces monashensis]|uniref:Uncharacterized protein n=1 Tax=Streptomyces monashensis TaxID=1678012 RepID=A0A1S2QMB1_9ACTN|nr:DUF6214 family protein [Streptomyces monashensis]OIK06777.1 hypothetical protein BIV23_06530 [Streptomyces monashensis]
MWPAWEVRERDGTLSWFHVRLAFPDGARVDALAVAREGRVSIEDVQAEPALSLADLTALADWLKGPLSGACGVAADTADRRADEGEGAGAGVEAEVVEGASDWVAQEGARVAEESYEVGVNTTASEGGEANGRAEGGEGGVSGEDGGEAVGVCATARRERSPWPRGVEGCRRAAQEYRAAQEEGADPVLAVMTATGRSRRRSLKLIAQARDAGFLTARHARRG